MSAMRTAVLLLSLAFTAPAFGQIGSMPIITAKAYPVAMPCSGTGLTDFQLSFRAPYGELLLVETQGKRIQCSLNR